MSNLEAIRKSRGMTQEALASAAGVSRPFISQIENGEYSPSLKTAKALATVLNCTIDELIGNEEGEDGDSERAEDGATRGAGPVRTA